MEVKTEPSVGDQKETIQIKEDILFQLNDSPYEEQDYPKMCSVAIQVKTGAETCASCEETHTLENIGLSVDRKYKHTEDNTASDLHVHCMKDQVAASASGCGISNKTEHGSKRAETNTEHKPYKCNACRKSFSCLSKHKRHKQSHTSERPYKCDICGKVFNQSNHLKIHMMTHTGEKPYKCDTCGKVFARSNNLKIHMRTHTGEKSHRYDACGKSFTQSNTLKIHMRTHTGEKPYKCDACGKSYTHSSSLKTQIRTHSDNKPYKCEIFIQSSNLMKHNNMRTHTGEKPYKCMNVGSHSLKLAV